MKYLLITKYNLNVSWEYYDNKKDKKEEFDYVDAWQFLASSWPGNQVVIIYNLSTNKSDFSFGEEADVVLKHAIKEYKNTKEETKVNGSFDVPVKKEDLPSSGKKKKKNKKKEALEEVEIDKLLEDLIPSGPSSTSSPTALQVKYTETAFGYQTCSAACCHQFFVSYPAHRKNTKLPVQAHLCNSTGAITSCQSIRCHRGRYFCPLHLEPVECILGTTKNYCLDCLFSFYFHALIELVHNKPITSYNGIFPKYFDKDEVPAKINSLKERIFCGIGFEDTRNKTVYRTLVTDYESQYVRVL